MVNNVYNQNSRIHEDRILIRKNVPVKVLRLNATCNASVNRSVPFFIHSLEIN